MTDIVLAIISAIVTLGVAYIGIYPKLVERKDNEQKEILDAVNNISNRLDKHEDEMKKQSDALMLIMRSNLHSRFEEIKREAKENGEPNIDDISDWWERYDSYKSLNGNHTIDRLAKYMEEKGWVV